MLAIYSHTRACGVWRDQDGMACGSLFDWPRCNGWYQSRTSDDYTKRGSFRGANDDCYRLFTRHLNPAMLATQVSDETSPQPLSLTVPKIVSRHWHDQNAKKLAAVSPDRHMKIQQPKGGKSVDRSKATVDLRPCRRPEGFTGLLRALNLSPGCDT